MIVLANPEDCEQVRHPDDILNLARREGEELGLRQFQVSGVTSHFEHVPKNIHNRSIGS